MTKQDIIELLENNKDERGIESFRNLGYEGMTSYGIGLTKLKAAAKKLPKDHKLAQELWETNIYEAKVISILIEEPELVSEDQVESQMSKDNLWTLAYVYCTMLIPKLPYAKELAVDWAESRNKNLRRCGYLIIYSIARDPKIEDDFFLPYLDIIEKEIQTEENFVKDAMNAAVMTIGLRSKTLNERAINAAKKIGKVEVDYGDNSCEAIDVLKHLTSPRNQEKLK